MRIGSDSLWIEPVSAPDWGRTIVVYSPTLKWLWLPFANGSVQRAEREAIIASIEARGMAVEWLGTIRTLRTKTDP